MEELPPSLKGLYAMLCAAQPQQDCESLMQFMTVIYTLGYNEGRMDARLEMMLGEAE